jgi:hypothetical protein
MAAGWGLRDRGLRDRYRISEAGRRDCICLQPRVVESKFTEQDAAGCRNPGEADCESPPANTWLRKDAATAAIARHPSPGFLHPPHRACDAVAPEEIRLTDLPSGITIAPWHLLAVCSIHGTGRALAARQVDEDRARI